MGYFDGLIGGTFKTSPEGQRLFFPWGALGRGYAIGSETDYERLRGQVKVYIAVGLAATVGPISFGAYALGFAALAVWMAFYVAWIAWTLRGLQPSTERMTSREAISAAARSHNPIFLWFGEVASLAFVAMGFFILVYNPGQWLAAGGGILFFGLCAFRFAQMLALRRRA